MNGLTNSLSREECEAIIAALEAKHGRTDVADLVADAADPAHPAHFSFEWDNTIAGHQWRLVQARKIIVFKIEVTSVPNSPVVTRPNVVSVRDVSTGARSYVSTGTKEGQDALLREALSGAFGLRQWFERYQSVLSAEAIKTAERLIRQIEKNLP